jgi:isopropylmalate/homocitrate/citramalate synthase
MFSTIPSIKLTTQSNSPITGFCAFTHKAGIHAKAILNNPSTYEIIDPADFGMSRYVHFASRLTGEFYRVCIQMHRLTNLSRMECYQVKSHPA